MTETAPVRLFQVERARVEVHQRKVEAGRAAAAQAARVLRSTLESKGSARIVVATGNSQEDLIEALRKILELTGVTSTYFTWTSMSGCRQTILQVSAAG